MNDFLTYMVNKLGRGEPPTPTNIAWNISPKVNAVFRNGSKEDKITLLQGFIGDIEPDKALKAAKRCHRRQTEEVKAIFAKCDERCIEHKNSVVVFIDNQYKEYTGLIASKFMSKYNKAAFVLRKPDPTSISGSFRSPVDILDLINDSGCVSARGHGQAAGFMCKASNLKRFFDWFDNQDLSELSGKTLVTAILTPKQITNKLCKTCEDYKDIWGHGVPEPTFYINAEIDETNVQVFEKRTTTVKITVNGVDFLLFMATPGQVDSLTQKGKKSLSLIITLSTNEWNGVVKPQGKIKQFEVSEVKDKDESWEDDF